MPNDYSDIGFIVEDCEDVIRLYEANADKITERRLPNGTEAVLRLDSGIELWFYGAPGEAVMKQCCEMGYHAPDELTARALMTCECKDCSIPILELLFDDGKPFALDVVYLNFAERNLEQGKRYKVNLGMFAENINVFENAESFNAGKNSTLEPESVVNIGAFAKLDGIRDPVAMISGTVKAFRLQKNELTGQSYAEFTVSCLGHSFTATADPVLFGGFGKLPVPGNIITGIYWISGTVIGEA